MIAKLSNTIFYSKLLDKLGWWLWLVLLLSIPVTSYPLIASFTGGETPVSPLAIIPLAGIVLLVFVPYILKSYKLPVLVWPLLIFALISITSAAASTWIPMLPFKGQTSSSRILRALITISVGIGFYLSAVLIPKNKRDLELSVRFIHIGLVITLIWSSVQAWFVLRGAQRFPGILLRIHQYFSVRDPVPGRVTGMAYEPSWFGDQLVIIYLPILLASVLLGKSLYPRLSRWISFESLLLAWSLFVLILTKSRISLISLLVIASLIFFYLGFRLINTVIERYAGSNNNGRMQIHRLILILSLILLIGLWIVSLAGAAWVFSQFDERVSALLSAPAQLDDFEYFYPNEAGYELADQLAFAERTIYWSVGMRTFSAFPVLGVGPGNTGFFFEKFLPPYGYQLVEIQNVLQDPLFGFPNPKNFWIRLLAETGIIGFSVFFLWHILTACWAYILWRNGHGINRLIGLAGVFGAVAFLFEGMSLDTFALPHFWILMGIVTVNLKLDESMKNF